MKSKNNQNVECFDQFKVNISELFNTKLPAKLWKFIDSVKEQPFDLLDILIYFKSDTTQAKKILTILRYKNICERLDSSELTYKDWKVQQSRQDDSPQNADVFVEDTRSTSSTLADDITVTSRAQDISVEIG